MFKLFLQVSITGVCANTTTLEALVIGAIGGTLATLSVPVINRLKIDDPAGAIPVKSILLLAFCVLIVWCNLFDQHHIFEMIFTS